MILRFFGRIVIWGFDRLLLLPKPLILVKLRLVAEVIFDVDCLAAQFVVALF
jgi:hypothetical protein